MKKILFILVLVIILIIFIFLIQKKEIITELEEKETKNWETYTNQYGYKINYPVFWEIRSSEEQGNSSFNKEGHEVMTIEVENNYVFVDIINQFIENENNIEEIIVDNLIGYKIEDNQKEKVSYLLIKDDIFFHINIFDLKNNQEIISTFKIIEEKPQEKEIIETKPEVDYFINCLIEGGMVIYASQYCPACVSLAESFGGYDKVGSLFVICNQEAERCALEMKDRFVPEIQIKGEVYRGPKDLNSLAQKTGCPL